MTGIETEGTRGGRQQPSASAGAPFFVSSVHERMAGDRRRTMVTISSSLPGPTGWTGSTGSTAARPRPRPGPRREPSRRPSPRPRVAAAGVRTTPAAPAPARPRTPPAPPGKPRPVRTSTRWPAALTLAALGLAVAVPFLVQAILLLTGDGGSEHRAAPPAASTAASPATSPAANREPSRAPSLAGDAPAGLLTWVRTELAPGAVVVTDARTAAELRRAGMRGAVGYADAPQRTKDADYVVDVPPAARADGSPDVRARFLARSLPLAVFPVPAGTRESDGASVRKVVRGTAAAARAAARADAVLRVEGGRELVRNPALRLDAATRDALTRGDIDLRIQTVLGDLATTGVVRVGQPEQDAAEGRAGLPIRSITISTGTPTATATATATVLRSLPVAYRPQRVEPVSTRVRAVWPPVLPAASVVANSGRDGALRITEVIVR